MTLVVVNQGEEDMLDAILGVNYTLRLFQNDVVSSDTLTEADFTEATFTGYSAVALTGGSWTTTAGDPTSGQYAQQSFISSADQAAQTVYGYYVTRTSDGRLQWFEKFSTPAVVEFLNDTIRITARITLADTQDA